MSHVEGGRISFPAAYRIRSLPGLPGPEYIQEQSVVASAHSVGTDIRESLDYMDQGCLITNVHRHTDQRAHIADAQREDPEEKQEVESLLIDLGLAPTEFDLDDISNIAWLDATLHKALDVYDIIAITASLNFGNDIFRFLENDLASRQVIMDMTGRLSPRKFEYFEPEFQLVVLHPDQLLPNGSTLLRRNSDDSYTPYKASSDKILRQVDAASILSSRPPDLTALPFPPFRHATERDAHQALNVYLVLLNAEIKFQRFARNIGLDKLHPDMRAIVEQTIRIVDLMYSEPVRSDACIALQASAKSEWSMRPHPDGEAALNYAEDTNPESDHRMKDGGTAGARSGAAEHMEDREHKPRPFSWDTLSHEERKSLGRDLLSRGSAFRHKSSPEDEETSEIHTPDETQRTRPLLLPVARDQDIINWAESIQ